MRPCVCVVEGDPPLAMGSNRLGSREETNELMVGRRCLRVCFRTSFPFFRNVLLYRKVCYVSVHTRAMISPFGAHERRKRIVVKNAPLTKQCLVHLLTSWHNAAPPAATTA